MVMVRIKIGRFLKGIYKKLHSKDIGPYKMLKKISSNAYVIDDSWDIGIQLGYSCTVKKEICAWKDMMSRKKQFGLIPLVVIWVLWKERNRRA